MWLGLPKTSRKRAHSVRRARVFAVEKHQGLRLARRAQLAQLGRQLSDGLVPGNRLPAIFPAPPTLRLGPRMRSGW
jgi:hypothetical protein